jgi:hypothetical protein
MRPIGSELVGACCFDHHKVTGASVSFRLRQHKTRDAGQERGGNSDRRELPGDHSWRPAPGNEHDAPWHSAGPSEQNRMEGERGGSRCATYG